MITEARINLALLGLLIGLYSFAFVFGTSLIAVLFLFAILVIVFISKYKNSTREDLLFLIGGIVLAVILCLVIPALSLITLSVELLVISGILVLLIVKN